MDEKDGGARRMDEGGRMQGGTRMRMVMMKKKGETMEDIHES